jgi:hypothetical protein
MLKKMLAQMFTPEVDYVDYQDGLLVFRASKALKPETSKVKLRMSFGTVAAYVVLQSVEDDRGIYRAQLLNYEVVLENLPHERRAEVRLPRVFRVSSPELPGYAGTTEDISLGGARVATSAPLEKDLEISLRLELDDPELPPLSLLADVMWTARRLDEGYHSGLKFLGLEHSQKRMLERFISERLAAEKRLHTLEAVE